MGYSGASIDSFAVVTHNNAFGVWGKNDERTFVKVFQFTKESRFVGFYGAHDGFLIRSMGVLIFRDRCMDFLAASQSQAISQANRENMYRYALESPLGYTAFDSDSKLRANELTDNKVVEEEIPIAKLSIAIWLPILILLALVFAILLLVAHIRKRKDDIVQVLSTND